MIRVELCNQGGVLDSTSAPTAAQAAVALGLMIERAGELYPGDYVLVSGEEASDED
jgi:hypothetical protein